MKTNYIVGLVVGAVVVLGGGYYFVATPKAAPSMEDNSDTMQQETGVGEEDRVSNTSAQPKSGSSGTLVNNASAGTFDGSVAALIARGGEWKCSVDTSTAQTVSSGQVFVAQGKFRGNFTTNVKGFGDVMSYMISDGVTQYTWSTASPTGFKMPASKASTPGSAAMTGQGSIDATHSYSYVCEPWSVDMSMFVPPNNVTFTSI